MSALPRSSEPERGKHHFKGVELGHASVWEIESDADESTFHAEEEQEIEEALTKAREKLAELREV